MTYQSHSESEKGMVDSAHRLTRLGIPANLDGATVLDIGCNEGYYCNVAVNRGAAKVIGIDGDPKPLAFARERYANPAIEFRHQHWSQLPEGSFDLAIWTSAMHYELDPLAILEQVRQRLKPNGLLILECGVVASHKKEMIPMQRHDGTCWYPSRRFIEEYLLSDFAFRQIGAPELIGTDPVPRYVYHCRRRIPTVLLFRGQTHTGKSSVAMGLYESATKVIELDLFVYRIATAKHHNTRIKKYIKEKNTGYDLTYLYEGIDSEGFTEDWARLLAKTVAATDKIVVIEGYMTEKQRDALQNATKGRVKFWEADAS